MQARQTLVTQALQRAASSLGRGRLQDYAGMRLVQLERQLREDAPTEAPHHKRSQADATRFEGPNFDKLVAETLEAAEGDSRPVSVLAIRIDHFDVVVASHGADVGAETIEIARARLREALRADDVLARLGSDGFALLWSPLGAMPDAPEVAARIAAQFDRPIRTSVGQLPITISIGVASADQTNELSIDAATLQRQAQTAVTTAQQNGRAQLVVFDQKFETRAIERYQTERHLRTAVRNKELSVAYQPIVNLGSGTVVGVEALARWRDESLGLVSPATFIPLAEDSGLIGELGQLVMSAAIAQAGTWRNNGAGDNSAEMMLTINLSNRQLLDPELIPSIATLLEQHELEARHLCLEITESVVMNNVAASMTILGHMKDLGLCLAIDDFGTGYSSLSYLRRLPVDILKIDQSFVQSVYNRDDRMITKAIIDLAHTLGMTTIAEGVETKLQVDVLQSLNCDMAQGFLLHPPTAAELVNLSAMDLTHYPEESGVTSVLGDSYFNESRGLWSVPASQEVQSVRL